MTLSFKKKKESKLPQSFYALYNCISLMLAGHIDLLAKFSTMVGQSNEPNAGIKGVVFAQKIEIL